MSKIDDKLPLPGHVETRLMAPEILVLRQVVPEWRSELIEVAENTKRWFQSGQVTPQGSTSYTGTHRTSRSVMLTHRDPLYGGAFRRFEEALLRVFHSGLVAYRSYNEHISVTHDSGYELLRYQPGEHFGLHTDTILGRNEGFRQLSGLLYLNDNYNGGETWFPRQNLKFKATAGDLLLFPSNFCYPHEALPVTQGNKYAVVTWFVAYPKLPTNDEEDNDGTQAEGNGDRTDADADVGLRLLEPA